jgi:tetratricopeptide (TPR) repeat protein
MRKSILNLLLLVAFLLGSTLVVPAEEYDVVQMIQHMKYHNAGADFYRAGQYNKALYCFDKAIETIPNYDPMTYELRAKIYFKFKKYDKAWDDVKKAQSIKVEFRGVKKFWEVDPEFLKELRKASGRHE